MIESFGVDKFFLFYENVKMFPDLLFSTYSNELLLTVASSIHI